jgi:hypothetical protein
VSATSYGPLCGASISNLWENWPDLNLDLWEKLNSANLGKIRRF